MLTTVRTSEDEQSPGIDPVHLLAAIENSLKHSAETSHGVTGLTFSRYRIVVHKKRDLCWVIECKFKTDGERNASPDQRVPRRLR